MTESPVRTMPVAAPAPAGAPPRGDRVRTLRRGPRETQRDFTVLLDVLARPGRIGRLRLPAHPPAAAAAACGLIDFEVPLHVLTDGSAEGVAWALAVHAATGAPQTEAARARCLLALRPLGPADIGLLHRGSPLDPETGARVFAQVDTLSDGTAGGADGAVTLAVTGPGVPTERRLVVAGLPAASVPALAEANAAFPCGVDLFLVAADGSVAGLPRTARVRLLGGA
ncbi:phosphonate C-P lyase system protein PhnH [Streptomyces sp. MP131-18]|uniref:phosphonate C-P lyase system protein PhnH n=1 Tax=Streptomyces sp. MP131-18 TaxID=1857892 RepID=UPI00097BB39C|nr:phosphonate C-P lyase system protein PhnH [Streptomyces sp. MP131-18]ONK09704.1 carbon-phosphorus lyase complex subunit [Streptomyces sp. MP131-18]